jgi:hypothetical protein
LIPKTSSSYENPTSSPSGLERDCWDLILLPALPTLLSALSEMPGFLTSFYRDFSFADRHLKLIKNRTGLGLFSRDKKRVSSQNQQ